jgi:hypothetical protein
MSHRTLRTAAGTVVNHSHPETSWEYSAAEKTSYQASTLASYPGTQALDYVHLDHSSEELLPSRRYNCWGFTFNPRQCWINSGTDVQNILNDNGAQVFAPGIRVGDVICYRDGSNAITHTGRVWSVTSAGAASLIQSKWGGLGEYLHPPLTVPSSYGTNTTYWRVIPLSDKGDAWHKDNASDDRLPYPPGVRWLSPDLWCNNSGGTLHQDPVRGQPNQLYARLHNPDTLNISNATVRFYWADPNGGIPHTKWNNIGMATVSVSPGGTGIAGPVSWTPGASVPNHSCLLAVADTGDDFHAAATLDPIVWPYDVARDNNVVQKNVSVITLLPSPSPMPVPLPFTALNPYPVKQSIEVRVQMRQVEAKELGEVKLDLQAFARDFERQAEESHWLPAKVRLAPTFLERLLLMLFELLLLPLRLLKLIPPKPAALEVGLAGGLRSFVVRREADTEMVLSLGPVAQGEGGQFEMKFVPTRGLSTGQTFRIDLEQRVDGVVTGGMTYVVVVGGGLGAARAA